MKLNNGTLEFDLGKLSAKVNRELEKYVNNCLIQMDLERQAEEKEFQKF